MQSFVALYRGNGPDVVQTFQAVGAIGTVELKREGKIVVFDALWAMAETAGGYHLLDPHLRELQDKLKDEIVEGPGSQS